MGRNCDEETFKKKSCWKQMVYKLAENRMDIKNRKMAVEEEEKTTV